MPATTAGKEAALKALAERRNKAKGSKPVDNSALLAGSPMYFYCIGCGLLADVLPEDYRCSPKRLCGECQALKDLNWLE